MKHSNESKDITSGTTNIDSIPINTVLYKYLKCLESPMKATRLAKKIRRWFSERCARGKESFEYRFTGKESKAFCWYFGLLCSELIHTPGITQGTLCHIMSLAFSGMCLRNSVSLYSRVHIDQARVDDLQKECEQYYNCQVLLLGKVKPTMWTIGKAIPFYTRDL